MKKIFLLTILVLNVSCAMMSSRSYLAEMEEQEDYGFFSPEEDFPIVEGDTGQIHRSRRDVIARTPLSTREKWNMDQDMILEDELRSLESSQSEGSFAHYQQVKRKLPTTSEKIYFLKLRSKAERDDYLASKGFSENYPSQRETAMAVRQSDLILGMSKDDVMSSLGQPNRVEVAGNPRYENERWFYSYNGVNKFIYFEGGRVQGWTENP